MKVQFRLKAKLLDLIVLPETLITEYLLRTIDCSELLEFRVAPRTFLRDRRTKRVEQSRTCCRVIQIFSILGWYESRHLKCATQCSDMARRYVAFSAVCRGLESSQQIRLN